MELSLLKKQNILKKKFNLDCSTKYEFTSKKKVVASDKYKKLSLLTQKLIPT